MLDASRPLIYVGSSWKNAEMLSRVHEVMHRAGLRTWDFRNNGFWWEDVDPAYKVNPFVFLTAPESVIAFAYDKEGLDTADAGLFILPAGVSTALEAGYMAGLGKPTFVWGTPREPRLDIMWKLTTLQFSQENYSLEIVAEVIRKSVSK
jgi:nucleoside 2-deoxyribosyltransferase